MESTQQRVSIQLPATREYRRFLARLARHVRPATQAQALDAGISLLAASLGEGPSPPRTPGRGDRHEGDSR